MSGIFITEEDIQKLSTPKSYERGLDLYYSGSIYSTYRHGRDIHGKCEGSELPIYDVEVEFEGDEIDANCTCPYDWGGYCKHIVALLLTFIHEEEKFLELKDPATLVEPLDRESLIIIISELVNENPDLQIWLEKFIKTRFEN